MSKRHEAKYKIDRRMGQNIWGRPKSPVNRREYGPGQHGQRRKGKVSDYGVQLRAKQKLKGYYGDITEKQFKRSYTDAIGMKGDASQNLIGLLDCSAETMKDASQFSRVGPHDFEGIVPCIALMDDDVEPEFHGKIELLLKQTSLLRLIGAIMNARLDFFFR